MLSHDNSYLATYKERLLKKREAALAKKVENEKPLRERIAEWYKNQPASEKLRPYSMNELVQYFNLPPSVIGPALHELGWKRIRVWGDGPYLRLWSAKV